MTVDPIATLLAAQPVVILDGGLGSELGFRGHDLRDHLWSARLLVDDPGAIKQLHIDYLEAGADVVTTASYQVSYEGFQSRGLARSAVDHLLRRSVSLARDACDAIWEECESPASGKAGNERISSLRSATVDSSASGGRVRPLVAASVGPYGAAKGDGSEYVGRYGLSSKNLADWHRQRMETLAQAGADLLACETIPCIEEAEALLGLLAEEPRLKAWMSFSCRDGEHISQGELFEEAVALCADSPQVIAVGLNCVKPRFVSSLLRAARGVAKGKPLIAYPNSAETWDPGVRAFVPGDVNDSDISQYAPMWRDEGALLLGGCCRIRPADIRRLRQTMLGDGPMRGD
ncbi:MAG: homocysteine S-methyltransferase [Polyangia bacterium]|jgi:homocysteine S-methyltransferase|nr:homocysteine S-methyltransferase [Polyangia bacterium]